LTSSVNSLANKNLPQTYIPLKIGLLLAFSVLFHSSSHSFEVITIILLNTTLTAGLLY